MPGPTYAGEQAGPTGRTRTLRVLVVLPAAVLGGAERWLLDLLDATDRLDVRALSLADGPVVAALRDRGVAVTVVPTGRRAVDGLRPGLRLRAALRADRPDVVLASGVKAAAVALPVAAWTGVPAVWVKHDRSFDGPVSRGLGWLADRVVATEAGVGQAAGRADIVIIEPPAPGPALARDAAREVLGLPRDELVLALVGRLVDYKGGADAVRALALPDAAGWSLLVIGEDDPAAPGERCRLEKLVAELGLADRVRFTGAVPDAGRLVGAADALAVLTRPVAGRSPGREGFGITALEAARAGVPVLAVAGSPPAQRAAAGGGLVVPAADPPAVARALGQLADPARREAMGRAGRSQSARHPDAAACADRLAAVLAQAACRPGAGLQGPPASVVVTVRDEQAAVPGLLSRLLPQLRSEDELVVVDGGSRDDTVGLLRRAAADEPRLAVLELPGAGISQGRNHGVRAARHPVIACTDAGCEPEPTWLAALLAGFAEQNRPDLVTGVYRATARPGVRWEQALAAVGYPDPAEARRRTPLVRAYGALFGRTYDPALPTGRSMAFTRAAFLSAGGFPEHLATGEDVSYGQAVVAAGGQAVLAVDAEVSWAQRPSLRSNLAMYRSYGRGDGLTGSRLLVGRNVVRALAYPLGVALLRSARPGARGLALVGAAAYFSIPLQRAARHPGCLPAVPVVGALRDGAKAWGCVDGLRARRP